MTLYTFPDPRADARAVLASNVALWPAGTTWGEKVAAVVGAAPHIQYAWDGTPTQQQNREGGTLRLTVWGWKVVTGPNTSTTSEDDLSNFASLVRAVFLASGTSNTWRYTPGAGRVPGIDSDSKVPFVTFTVTAETRPHAVA